MLDLRDANLRERRILRCSLLSAASLLCLAAVQPAGAQEVVDAPPPVQSPDDYVPPAPDPAPDSNTVATNTVTEAETVLPPKTPDYFEALYPHYMKAPLPSKGYHQRGIPTIIPAFVLDRNPFGALGNFLPGGPVNTRNNAFFQDLVKLNTGYTVNGRSCGTCHQPGSAMSISLRNIKARFNATRGTDPLFAPVDGANCPDALPPQYTTGAQYGGLRGKGRGTQKAAHSAILNKGLIRIPMPWPPKDENGNPRPVEFTLEIYKDPLKCNTSPDFGLETGFASVYRRPIISAQMNFKTVRQTGQAGEPILAGSVMWDGREKSLEQQAIDATRGHAQSPVDPTPAQVAQIVKFENEIFSAQYIDKQAGYLDAAGATGGPVNLSGQPVLGFPNFIPPFDEYTLWLGQAGERGSIERGQTIFNSRRLIVGNVGGFNGGFLPNPVDATCSTCHNVPHAGADFIPDPQRDLALAGRGWRSTARSRPTTYRCSSSPVTTRRRRIRSSAAVQSTRTTPVSPCSPANVPTLVVSPCPSSEAWPRVSPTSTTASPRTSTRSSISTRPGSRSIPRSARRIRPDLVNFMSAL